MATRPAEMTVDLKLGESLDLDQYFGLWAVDDGRFMQLFDQVRRMDLAAHLAIHANDPVAEARVAIAAGGADDPQVAVIEMSGTLTKRGSSMSAAGSMVRIRQAVRAAARDPEIGGILLRIDSPGGTVAGTADLAAEVAAAAQKKPVYAFAEDLMASAAYWVGSQGAKIYANDRTAMVGSIGTFVGLYDLSAAAAKDGIRAVVIKSGRMKGAGFPGTEITDEQRAYWQAIVDKTQQEFSAGVSRGRKLAAERVTELADGRIHVAGDALAMGLIDGIQSFEATLAELRAQLRGPTSSLGKRKMSETNTSPTAASYAELKAGLVGADAAFLCSQLERGATLAQAQAAWMAEQHTRLEAATKATAEALKSAEEAKTAAAASAKRAPGVETLGNGSSTAKGGEAAGDPIVAFNEAVQAKIRLGMTKAKATAAVCREDPELREAYVEAHNAAHPQTRRN